MIARRTESPSGTSTDRKFAVFLLAHGTPETAEEVPAYLKNVVSGRPVPASVVEEIQHRYARIGKSPLTEWTNRQAACLQKKVHVQVYVGMRNWKPYIADAVRAMRNDGVTDAVAICLAPQNSRTSVGLYRRAAFAEAGGAIRFHFVDSWADHPLLVEAFADRLRPVWRDACRTMDTTVPVVFTAHSVPCRTMLSQPSADATGANISIDESASAAGSRATVRPPLPERSYALPGGKPVAPDPYAVEAKQTARLVAERLANAGLTERDWYFAFQSQGMSGGPWIGPTVEDTLRAIRFEGRTGAVLQPVGFLCDHVEILYDIDIGFQELARSLNLHLFRTESLNDSPVLIDALVDLTARGMTVLRETPNAQSTEMTHILPR